MSRNKAKEDVKNVVDSDEIETVTEDTKSDEVATESEVEGVVEDDAGDEPHLAEDTKPEESENRGNDDVESTEDAEKHSDESHVVPDSDQSTGEYTYTFANPVVLYRSPSDKLPLCRVSLVRFTGTVINGYAKCFSNISGQGRTHGYVKTNPVILNLLSIDK